MKSLSNDQERNEGQHQPEVTSWQLADLVNVLEETPADNFELTPTAVTLTSKKSDIQALKWEPGKITPVLPSRNELELDDQSFEEGVSDEETQFISQIEQQMLESEQTLANAKAEAEKIIQQAQQEFEQQKQAGYQQGLEDAKQETLQKYDELKELVADTFNWHQDILNTGEEVVINLVIDIARKLFSSGMALDRQVLHQAYARAIAEAKSLGDLRIHVNPSDEITIDPLWTSQITSFTGQEIEWVPNQNILPGGCLIEGQFGSVDAKVESQLETLLDLIKNTLSD